MCTCIASSLTAAIAVILMCRILSQKQLLNNPFASRRVDPPGTSLAIPDDTVTHMPSYSSTSSTSTSSSSPKEAAS